MINLESLNTGIARVVSVKKYPVTRRQQLLLSRSTKGRVFRIGVLHSKEMTEAMLLKNRRGFVNSQVNTVAHAPSLYHWLFHRCGIPFEETRELVSSRGLAVDGIAVDHVQLETQRDWAAFQQKNILIRTSMGLTQGAGSLSGEHGDKQNSSNGNNSSSSSSTRGDNTSEAALWVPALKRALHRQYFLLYLHPGISITSDQTDPRSFIHRLTPAIGTTAGLGMNILRPIGFMNGMRGLGIATNDVSMARYWNNEFLGNYGVYDVRFPRGVPPEVLQRLSAEINADLSNGIRRQLSRDVRLPCSCTVERVPAEHPRYSTQRRDAVSEMYTQVLHDERLMISTPLLPYRVARKIRCTGGLIALVRSGPFVLPPSLRDTKVRRLSPQELALMFTFERKLKTNRVVLSLREFEAGTEEASAEGIPSFD